MDADGLPIVGPGIDYTKVEALSQKKTVAFLNHFITHTSRFLNRFSNVCEEKLEHLDGRLKQLEISLSVLEAKISSIPGLDSVTAPQSSTSSQPAAQENTASDAPPPAPSESAAPAPPLPNAPEAPAVPEPAEAKPNNPVSQDPRFVKYFKMLQFGVPPPVVAMKMSQEGLDPSYLDTPDAPAPEGGPAPGGQSDSDSDSDEADSDFSD